MKKIQYSDCLFLNKKEQIVDFFLEKEKCLLIVGKGFDPRTTSFISSICKKKKDMSIWIIDYNEQSNKNRETNLKSRSENNLRTLMQICSKFNHEILEVPTYEIGIDGKRSLIISESIRKKINKNKLLEFDYIIIDISAMTKAASFSLVNYINKQKRNQKLYVVVTENSDFDNTIIPTIEEDSAELLQGFRTFGFSLASDNDYVIWFPALGEYSEKAFEMINRFLKPIEICPIVPFPAEKVNRGESILRSMGELLFREHQIDKRNIILVPEKSPILVAQKLYNTIMYYERVLSTDEEKSIKFVFSSQASKLIDLGILLTMLVFDKNKKIRVSFAWVETSDYKFDKEYDIRLENTYCFCFDDNEFDW